MQSPIWLHAHDEVCAETVEGVVERLKGVGIRIVGGADRTSCSIGIVLFRRSSEEVIGCVANLSRRGEARVLGLQIGEDGDGDHWSLLAAGASDVLQWGEDGAVAQDVIVRLERWCQIEATLESNLVRNNLIGRSPAWRSKLRQIVEAARYTDSSMLITGESGTGKELIARLVHTLDGRPNKGELVVLDCTTIVPELSGSELFGHERGAFTGAATARDGALAMANGGTLFLDEAGELPAGMQAQLLRAIQERTYKRVGGNHWLKSDFRLICATNRNLRAEVASGTFRGDLYYRIASWTCELPPLRERAADILPLAEYFLHGDANKRTLCSALQDYLVRREWPGNVRELRQLMLRVRGRHVGNGSITIGDLPEEERCMAGLGADYGQELEQAVRRALSLGVKLKELGQHASETAVRIAMEEENGNLQRAARRLGVTDRALQLRRANRSDAASSPRVSLSSLRVTDQPADASVR